MYRAIVERSILVDVERRPRRAINARRKRIRIVRGPAGEREDAAGVGIEDDRRAGVRQAGRFGRVEGVFDCLLEVVIDRQLQPLSFGRRIFLERPNLAPDAVDDDALGAVLAHQHRVVDLLDPGLPDDVAALQPFFAGGDLRVVHFADVSERVRRHRLGILARRHLFDDDVGQLEVEPPRLDGGHLRERRVLHDRDRPVGRLAAMTLDDRAHPGLVHAEDAGEQTDRAVQVFRVLAHDRNAVGVAVLDEHLAFAVEDDAARRAQGERPLMVVLRHLFELRVLDDLQHPEADGENREDDRDDVLQNGEAHADAAPFYGHEITLPPQPRSCRAAPLNGSR